MTVSISTIGQQALRRLGVRVVPLSDAMPRGAGA